MLSNVNGTIKLKNYVCFKGPFFCFNSKKRAFVIILVPGM